jgi:hypothetical protein
MSTRKLFEWGGIAASLILVVFGIISIVVSVNGRDTARSSLKAEAIVGTPDMTPSAIKAEAQKAGLNLSKISLPTQSVANKAITTGQRARIFAEYMRIHTLEATHGFTYSQMGIYTAKPGTPSSQLMPGGGTEDVAYAAIDPKTKQPVQNGPRQIWVTETALTTALNSAYMAERLAMFGIMVGLALLLSGIGFSVLTVGGALRGFEFRGKEAAAAAPKVAVTTS